VPCSNSAVELYHLLHNRTPSRIFNVDDSTSEVRAQNFEKDTLWRVLVGGARQSQFPCITWLTALEPWGRSIAWLGTLEQQIPPAWRICMA
jgi:hypothetical protein